jgi:8-oxo-dGTP diphosphatase
MKELPADLAAFAREVIGEIAAITDRSWARQSSEVWEITDTAKGHWFVKCHPSRRFHEREVVAYRQWVRALGAGRAPVLIAADASRLAIITSAIPGQVVRGLSMTKLEEREVHWQAGILLRALHESAPPVDAMPVIRQAVSQMEVDLPYVSKSLTTAQIALVCTSAAVLPALASGLAAVPVHGDAQPRNWLWDQSAHCLAMIDFEWAGAHPAVRDMVRLEYGAWDQRPDLRQAFLAGYGRAFRPREDEAFRCLLALDALNAVRWGEANNDPEITSRGCRTLDGLLARHSQAVRQHSK